MTETTAIPAARQWHAMSADAALAALDGAPGIVRAGLFGRELHVDTAEAASGEAVIAGHLAGAGVALRALAPVAPSLEDTFIARVEATGGAVAG